MHHEATRGWLQLAIRKETNKELEERRLTVLRHVISSACPQLGIRFAAHGYECVSKNLQEYPGNDLPVVTEMPVFHDVLFGHLPLRLSFASMSLSLGA